MLHTPTQPGGSPCDTFILAIKSWAVFLLYLPKGPKSLAGVRGETTECLALGEEPASFRISSSQKYGGAWELCPSLPESVSAQLAWRICREKQCALAMVGLDSVPATTSVALNPSVVSAFPALTNHLGWERTGEPQPCRLVRSF